MRNHNFCVGEYYHVYNRGSDKRDIILDEKDLNRFLQTMIEMNTETPVGGIYANSFRKNQKLRSRTSKLVDIVAYCINQNHFHFILTPIVEKGIEKYMQRIGGYTKYFNEKYKRSGVLFQGKYKSKYVKDNNYLIHLSAYVNMNNRNLLRHPTSKLSKSSLEEYLGNPEFCNFSIILEQFGSKKEYEKYITQTWKEISKRKEDLKDLEFEK